MGLDLIKIQKRLYIKYPIFGSLLTKVRLEKNNMIRTAATNGQVVYYNEALGILWNEETVLYFDCSAGYMNIYICQNLQC